MLSSGCHPWKGSGVRCAGEKSPLLTGTTENFGMEKHPPGCPCPCTLLHTSTQWALSPGTAGWAHGFDLQESAEPQPEPPRSSRGVKPWHHRDGASHDTSASISLALAFDKLHAICCVGYKGLHVMYMLAMLLRAYWKGRVIARRGGV